MARLGIFELDCDPALLLRLAARFPSRYPLLLDSASAGPLARYSVLVAQSAGGDALWLDRHGRLHARGEADAVPRAGGFLAALDAWWRRLSDPAPREQAVPEAGPFAGGLAVFLGYEVAAEVETRLAGVMPPAPEPLAAFALRCPAALVLDHAAGRVRAVIEQGEQGAALLAQIREDLRRAAEASPAVDDGAGEMRWQEEPPERFLQRVVEVQSHIRAGDIYQANLSRSWCVELAPSAADPAPALYRRLRRANPAPFAAWSRWGGMEILSSSPERLLRLDAGGNASTRPIAGTRPRDPRRDPEADAALTRELVANAKERAEHVMLIDLERNDLGRVCEAGTVAVPEYMTVETYAHVHHIVSEVAGRLRQDVTPVGALAAVFPGGTITGCPKLRCMEIIAALEGEGRGPYTGTLGLIGRDGSADFNILIRTLSLAGGVLRLRAGAGIVADSVASRELEETRAKARGVLAAVATER